uniref:Uncharacterized protein n=1 Tax=Anguilla anguilla TaxID=7936 RepID=A0A0E9VEJ9_ANGAN
MLKNGTSSRNIKDFPLKPFHSKTGLALTYRRGIRMKYALKAAWLLLGY